MWPRGVVVGDPGADELAGVIEIDEQAFIEKLVAHPAIEGFEVWPAPGSEDTELGVILEPEVVYGTQTLCTRVQA